MIGKLVRSKAGHDKDSVYIVLSVDDRFAFVADGRYKPIANPKRKNIKHLQIINKDSEVGNKILNNEEYSNEEIKRVIKMFEKTL